MSEHPNSSQNHALTHEGTLFDNETQFDLNTNTVPKFDRAAIEDVKQRALNIVREPSAQELAGLANREAMRMLLWITSARKAAIEESR